MMEDTIFSLLQRMKQVTEMKQVTQVFMLY